MKTLVIGGGMSGLTYGILSVKNGIETVICEKNSRVGKKMALTGNGKCNIGNANVSAGCFNNSKLVEAVLASVPVDVYRQFLQSCGIYTRTDSVGRMYPLSESATNVVDCLRFQFAKYGGKILTDCEITSVRPTSCGYTVRIADSDVVFDKVVLACGSASSAAETNAQALVGKQYFTPTCPSLVPVKISNMDKLLNGLRAKAVVKLLADGVEVGSEIGEVQFKDYGLSGIAVFNLSAIIARNTVCGKKARYEFHLDLVPEISEAELTEILQSRVFDGAQTMFLGILHNKLAETLVKRVGTSPKLLAQTAKSMKFTFDRLLDFSKSQVTAGGVAENYVDLLTLATPNGVVALGEVLNVDGLCGGNNLYFAAASALYLFDETQRRIAFGKR